MATLGSMESWRMDALRPLAVHFNTAFFVTWRRARRRRREEAEKRGGERRRREEVEKGGGERRRREEVEKGGGNGSGETER